jgi:D-glycero-D-manno-heptose 1,7-bisphosphate phosphatase
VTLEATRAVILDRDGTIVADIGYLDDPARLEFLPGAAEGLRRLHASGYRIVVVTNQSGVGRGRFALTRLHEIHATLLQMARQAGAPIDAIYYCPHRPEENCACRKPKPKLLLQAAAELGFEPSAAVVIGDKSSDIELGRSVGAVTMLVSETGRDSEGKLVEPDYVIRDLLEAARLLGDPEFTVARPRGGAGSRR